MFKGKPMKIVLALTKVLIMVPRRPGRTSLKLSLQYRPLDNPKNEGDKRIQQTARKTD